MNSTRPVLPADQQILVLRMIWGALFSSVVLLGVVLAVSGRFVLDSNRFRELTGQGPYLVFFVIGVVLLTARVFLSNTVFQKSVEKIALEDSSALVQAYTVPFILRLALAEATAVAGFVCAFLHEESTSYLILGGAAAAAVIREFPSLPRIQQLARFLLSNRVSRTRG
ncbi:MAG: hypothetical protein ACK5Y2_04040 [Bdellovibrionales bacterium]